MNLMPNIVFLSLVVEVSKFEIESALLQFSILVRIKPKQLRRPMPTGHVSFLEWNKQSEAQHFFSEVPFVQIGFQNGLVKMLQLREREFERQQFETDRLITDLAFEA